MVVMLPLLLLISQAASQPPSPQGVFGMLHTVNGEVNFKQADISMIGISDYNTRRLRATLKVISGEANLAAMAYTRNGKKTWKSSKVGDDEIVIEATDPFFIDVFGGLFGHYMFVVVGMAQQASQYSLTIKAEFTTQTLAALPVALSEFTKVTESFNIHYLNLFDGVISAFTKKQTMSGELAKQQTTVLLITVTNPTVKQLRATLKVASGDCDLYAITSINQIDSIWSSMKMGNDEIVIRADDVKFTDGQKLIRDFIFVVVGMSAAPSAYVLTITAEYTYTTLIATPTAIAGFVLEQNFINLVIANEPLSAFTTTQTLKGEIEYKQADAMRITVQDPNTRLLHIKLTVLSGDSDLYVLCYVNNVEKMWQSLKSGSDEITIIANDGKFTDNKGLQRDFIVVVVGMSRVVSSYELVVTAKQSSTVLAALSSSMQLIQFAEPISAFGKVHVITWDSRCFYSYECAYIIEVQDPTIHQLRFTLTSPFDIEIYFYITSGMLLEWWSDISIIGKTEMVINKNDVQFIDGKGLLREFVFRLGIDLFNEEHFELKITAESSSTAVYDSGAIQEWSEQHDSRAISVWWVLPVAAVGVAAAFWMWTDLRGSRKKSISEYVLL